MTTDIPGTWEPIRLEDVPPGATFRAITTYKMGVGAIAAEIPGGGGDYTTYEIFRPDPLAAPPRSFWRDPDTDAVYCRTAGDPDSWAFVVIDPGDSDVGYRFLTAGRDHLATISRLVPA